MALSAYQMRLLKKRNQGSRPDMQRPKINVKRINRFGKVSYIEARTGSDSRASMGRGDIDYDDPEGIIIGFWRANIGRDYRFFNFNRAFITLKEQLEGAMEEQGLLNVENYREWIIEKQSGSDWFNQIAPKRVKELVKRGLSEDEIFRVLSVETFPYASGNQVDWIRAYRELERVPRSPVERALLMDRLIWLAHDRGWVFNNKSGEEIDVAELHERFERGEFA